MFSAFGIGTLGSNEFHLLITAIITRLHNEIDFRERIIVLRHSRLCNTQVLSKVRITWFRFQLANHFNLKRVTPALHLHPQTTKTTSSHLQLSKHGINHRLHPTLSKPHSPHNNHPPAHSHRPRNKPPRAIPRQSPLSQTRRRNRPSVRLLPHRLRTSEKSPCAGDWQGWPPVWAEDL
jgi:hypothetical protein